MQSKPIRAYFQRHIALPTEHGSWVFILSPLLIGLFAARTINLAIFFLIMAALSAFLIRQPVTIAVKVNSGRRPRRDLPAAWFWIMVYSLLGLLSLAGLIALGYGFVLFLAIPGLPVFAWHLYLVSRRAERRQAGVEIVASGVLALAAPAAYWVGMGAPDPLGWWLFLLTWAQSAASIVYAYLRLEQRNMLSIPTIHTRLRQGRRALIYATFNVASVTILSILEILPPLLPLPYALQWAETIYCTMRPAIGVKPTRIGIRALTLSTLFTLLFIITWNIP